jgi:hypothetical protein
MNCFSKSAALLKELDSEREDDDELRMNYNENWERAPSDLLTQELRIKVEDYQCK